MYHKEYKSIIIIDSKTSSRISKCYLSFIYFSLDMMTHKTLTVGIWLEKIFLNDFIYLLTFLIVVRRREIIQGHTRHVSHYKTFHNSNSKMINDRAKKNVDSRSRSFPFPLAGPLLLSSRRRLRHRPRPRLLPAPGTVQEVCQPESNSEPYHYM